MNRIQTNMRKKSKASVNEICVTASKASVFHFVTVQERRIAVRLRHGRSRRQIQLLLASVRSNHKTAKILRPRCLRHALTGRKRTRCRNPGTNPRKRENRMEKRELDNKRATGWFASVPTAFRFIALSLSSVFCSHTYTRHLDPRSQLEERL